MGPHSTLRHIGSLLLQLAPLAGVALLADYRRRFWAMAKAARHRPRPEPPPSPAQKTAVEVEHWNEIERRARNGGERLFWLQQPRVGRYYLEKSLIDGVPWQYWLPQSLGGPVDTALELGCGNGEALSSLLWAPTARSLVGIDLDETRFEAARQRLGNAGADVRLVAADINHIRLERHSYDLIYAIQAFHHFENLEHLFAEIDQALRPGGLCVLDEYVGPARFQWTDVQLSLTAQILGLLPKHLRLYANGVEKLSEGRSSVEEVIRVCPSEAIRADEIVPLFYQTFDVLHHKNLGGTIQHLLYSGIVHNFPDDDPATDHLIDCVDGLERSLIEHRVIPSDFVLLIGRKRG